MSEAEYKKQLDELKSERRKEEQANHKALEERVTNLEDLASKIYLQNERQSLILNQIADKQNSINVSLNGTEEEPEKGLKVRVDRLEEKARRASWLSTTAFGALIAAIVAWLFSNSHK